MKIYKKLPRASKPLTDNTAPTGEHIVITDAVYNKERDIWMCGDCGQEVVANGEHLCELKEKKETNYESKGGYCEIHTGLMNNGACTNPDFCKKIFDFGVEKERQRLREEIVKMLDNWTDFTCHSKAEHANNDCPGWSHENQSIRELVISQVRYRVLELINTKE